MPSLKEIKGRINSVRSTLKITTAMKMVASAKLHKAQNAIGGMLPYQTRLNHILEGLRGEAVSVSGSPYAEEREVRNVALIAFASNTSLCGSFNSSAIRLARKVIKEYKDKGVGITVYSVGRKMADALKKEGYPSPGDWSSLSEHPAFEGASALASEIMEAFTEGKYDRVELVYNHFQSTASQPSLHEAWLPLSFEETAGEEVEYIVEPSREELLLSLLPNYLRLKVFTVLLDTAAAEHAARTVAMQTATDNGNEILEDLTLEYNKSRQQKITGEILDIAGGRQE